MGTGHAPIHSDGNSQEPINRAQLSVCVCEGELCIKPGRERNGKEKLKKNCGNSQFGCLLVPAWVTQTTTGKAQDAKLKMQSDSQAGNTN